MDCNGHPPYSQDLATLVFHLFGPMKVHFRGVHFLEGMAFEMLQSSCFGNIVQASSEVHTQIPADGRNASL